MTAISFPQRLTSVESDIARIAPDRTIPMIRIIAPIESDERSCIESPICIIEEKHHGRIEFDSEAGSFTIFTLIIPMKA